MAKRWEELISEFTQGNPGIYQGLQKSYSDGVFPLPYNEVEGKFIQEVLAIYKQNLKQ
ncbi:MerR family transcriptional regulator [Effusibacillus lacus]|uniref:MerR family transcriptional regulator n=1 Tax=Effusibacillus lacus TaxID=1348429 RepID=A0A292YPP4_9BACL|nr:MerR family transcriptional regulator [Effusibacillus lacus]